MTRPEEVLALPLTRAYSDGSGPECVCSNDSAVAVTAWGCGCCQAPVTDKDIDRAAALVTMCNAYPLALALAKAVRDYMEEPTDPPKAVHMAVALSAFLSHRQEATR